MSVKLNGSTSGYTEIDAQASPGNNTIKMPASNGAAYQILRNGASAGTTEFADKIVSGTAQASTSGTSIDFTDIPSWVKRVTVLFNGVSTNGTSLPIIRIGAGSIVASGYASIAASCGNAGTFTVGSSGGAGFDTTAGGYTAAATLIGSAIIYNLSGNLWVCTTQIGNTGNGIWSNTSGSISLSGTLDRIRITTVNGTDTFDAGSINIMYE